MRKRPCHGESLLAGEHRSHAGRRLSACRVDVQDARVRVRAAEEGTVEQARKLDVVEVLRLPCEHQIAVLATKLLR